jgi:hypothetical protein
VKPIRSARRSEGQALTPAMSRKTSRAPSMVASDALLM